MADSENPSGEDFATLFEQSQQGGSTSQAESRSIGDVVVGTIVSISAEAAFVDLGAKSEGVLDRDQIVDNEGNLTVAVGDEIEARIVDAGERSGSIMLRRTLGRGPAARSELRLAYEEEIPVEGLVEAVNKGGFDVQIAGGRAFCPVSQMDVRFVDNPESFIGQRHQFRITRYEEGGRGGDNVVVSRRALLEDEADRHADVTRAKLEVGAIFPGKVTRIENYGAFVDIGGIEGMLHISELAYGRVEHPSEVVAIDQTLDVQVIKIEATDNPRRPEKIGLSIRSLARDPWDDVASTLRIGQQLEGTVKRIEAFGAFVEVATGIEGLVHISEMGAGERISSPRKVVDLGQTVSVTVLSIDPKARRIALSMDAASRATLAAEEKESIAKYAPSSQSLGTLGDLLNQQTEKK